MTDEAPKRFNRWTVVGFTDARTAKVALCRCDCGQISRVSYQTLTSGGHVECASCSPPRNLSDRSERTSFAAEFASAESRGAWKRHKGGGS